MEYYTARKSSKYNGGNFLEQHLPLITNKDQKLAENKCRVPDWHYRAHWRHHAPNALTSPHAARLNEGACRSHIQSRQLRQALVRVGKEWRVSGRTFSAAQLLSGNYATGRINTVSHFSFAFPILAILDFYLECTATLTKRRCWLTVNPDNHLLLILVGDLV